MRLEKEYIFNDLKVTIFYWNNKYLLKFEIYGMEQTYKFSELDFTIEEVEDLLQDDFLKDVKENFHRMNQNLQKAIANGR